MLSDTEPVERETRLYVWLFGKPAWELEGLEGGELDSEFFDEVGALGKELHERLEWASRTAKVLLDHGWSPGGGLYDITFYKPISEELARKELQELGLNPDDLSIEEEEIEDE
jgi:hypothetical protein